MSRLTRLFTTRLIFIPVVIVMAAGLGVGLWIHDVNSAHVQTVTNAHHQITEISYRGKDGVNAFTLLQENAHITYKHYSFGNFVISIDGVKGDGPKYWTLYVNHKKSSVGASDYVTKNSDKITWKLQ